MHLGARERALVTEHHVYKDKNGVQAGLNC